MKLSTLSHAIEGVSWSVSSPNSALRRLDRSLSDAGSLTCSKTGSRAPSLDSNAMTSAPSSASCSATDCESRSVSLVADGTAVAGTVDCQAPSSSPGADSIGTLPLSKKEANDASSREMCSCVCPILIAPPFGMLDRSWTELSPTLASVSPVRDDSPFSLLRPGPALGGPDSNVDGKDAADCAMRGNNDPELLPSVAVCFGAPSWLGSASLPLPFGSRLAASPSITAVPECNSKREPGAVAANGPPQGG